MSFSFGEFLFPPIFDRMQVTEDLVSDYMRERMIEDENEKDASNEIASINNHRVLFKRIF